MSTQAPPTIVQTHPWLLPVIASQHPLHTVLFAAPAIALLGWVGMDAEPRSLLIGGMLFAGVLYWTFFEYAVHRWLYHTDFRSGRMRWFFETFHLYHHRDMSDHRVLNAGPLMIWPLLAFLLAVPFLLLGPAAAWIGIGLISAYLFYEQVHYGIHDRLHRRGYMAYIQRYHLFHHAKRWNCNYGNTSHLWDLIFRTYNPEYKGYEVSDRVRQTFVRPDA